MISSLQLRYASISACQCAGSDIQSRALDSLCVVVIHAGSRAGDCLHVGMNSVGRRPTLRAETDINRFGVAIRKHNIIANLSRTLAVYLKSVVVGRYPPRDLVYYAIGNCNMIARPPKLKAITGICAGGCQNRAIGKRQIVTPVYFENIQKIRSQCAFVGTS